MVVRGLLESQGIQTDVTALDAPQDILPGVGGRHPGFGKKMPPKRGVSLRSTRAPEDNSDDFEVVDAESGKDRPPRIDPPFIKD